MTDQTFEQYIDGLTDAAAEKIIAMIEQDVARRLLSSEAMSVTAYELFKVDTYGVPAEADLLEYFDDMATTGINAAIKAIGITVENQP